MGFRQKKLPPLKFIGLMLLYCRGNIRFIDTNISVV